MSIVRSIEVIAQSPNSFERLAARQSGKHRGPCAGSVFWIKNAECVVENDQITMYR